MEPVAAPPPDPASEQLMAVIGVSPILDPKGRIKITQDMRHKAARLPVTIATEMRRFLSDTEPQPLTDPPEFEYHQALEQITGLDPAARIAALSQAVDDADAVGVIVVAGRILKTLKDLLPIRSRKTVVGPVQRQPSDLILYRFRTVYAVADDPMAAIKDMREWTMSRRTARALKVMYPAVYEIAVEESLRALAALKGDRPSVEVPRTKQLLLEALWLTRSWTPDLGRAMQEAFKTKDQPEAQQQKRSLANSETDSSQTAIQRVATK